MLTLCLYFLYLLQKPLDEALVDPELLVMTDYGKMTKHQTLHLAFQALHGFVKRVGRLPKPRSQVSERQYKIIFIFLVWNIHVLVEEIL